MALGLLLIGIGTQIYSGIQAQKAADSEASYMRQQVQLQNLEADEEAKRIEREGKSFKKRQKMLFLKSGVALEGSPLLILEETEQETRRQVSAIRKRGIAQFRLGMQRAANLQKKGRAQLIGSAIQGATTAFIGATSFAGAGRQQLPKSKISILSAQKRSALPTHLQYI